MIVTKNWLNDWLEVDDISTEDICQKLNSIGLEVDSVSKIEIPKGVKVGYVKSCEKHPDADKLNVCQVDLGDEVVQIVCGAKNVKDGQFVPVATVGTVLDKDFKIKKAKLRGIDSFGMICSSEEIGLPKLEDGILVLDESVCELKVGEDLSQNRVLNDDIIDIELTANRGDCLSILGVARDLSAILNRKTKQFSKTLHEEIEDISNVLRLEADGDFDCDLEFRYFKADSLKIPLIYLFRLGCIGELKKGDLLNFLSYAEYSTGVILDSLKSINSSDKNIFKLKRDDKGFDAIFSDRHELLRVGFDLDDSFKSQDSDGDFILTASYVEPDVISYKRSISDLKSDDTFYKSSRGSEPNLSFGLDYLSSLLSLNSGVKFYKGCIKYKSEHVEDVITFDTNYLKNFVGQEIDSKKVLDILDRLGFEAEISDGLFWIKVPLFRRDVKNRQDIVEEIVRIVGIDNIVSKPLCFVEKRRLNNFYTVYKKRNYYRLLSAGAGFYEALHYIFDNLGIVKEYGLEQVDESLDIQNPITSELNTLRTTLLLQAIDSCSKNIKHGRKSVKLFEIGYVFNKNREQKSKIAFIFSGESEEAGICNHGKPKEIDFFGFAKLISKVIGEFDLVKADDKNSLVSPYEYARVILNGKNIGYIARLHLSVQERFDLPKTYICELDFDDLMYDLKEVEDYSKFPSLSRDISLVVPKNMTFYDIKEYLKTILPKEVKSFSAIDVYQSEDLGDNYSLTIRLNIQSVDSTLTDDEINEITENVVNSLSKKFGISLR